MKDPYCEHLASPNPWLLALSICLVLGILGSYIPQHAKIISNRTSAGLSPWWVLLGTLSSITAIANIVVLPTSQHDIACCREISGAACGAALLGVVQIGVQWTCFMAIMILFLVYFPRQRDDELPSEAYTDSRIPKPRDAIIVGVSSLCAILFVSIGSLVFLSRAPALLLGWANFLGVASSTMACIQYIPQIWTTWRIRKLLSLSITTMIIQVPGSFVFAFSLWGRVGFQGWSSWLVYCVTGCFQGCLLVMAIYFSRQERKEEVEIEEDGSEPGESERLLAPPTRSTRQKINGQKSYGSTRSHLSMLYSATPPTNDSVESLESTLEETEPVRANRPVNSRRTSSRR